jgi:hypothetical protein
MPKVLIGVELRITSTPHAWELQSRIPRKNIDDEWRHKGSYTSFRSALEGCRQALIRESSKDSYKDAKEDAENLISTSLKNQNIDIEDI